MALLLAAGAELEQPHGDPFDPAAPAEEIRRATEATCRADPGFMTVEQFRERMSDRLGDQP